MLASGSYLDAVPSFAEEVSIMIGSDPSIPTQ
ncbi:hypothetical protein VD0002_g8306 [Verticillium dahliae]|nr:hypothetical protein VD0004_g9059 [Verticillium dahliae]PNH46087.1 hypothetical protein VD0003_g9074 [Verticillium dahliae]PNH59232.1 hypothetical protein VD0002_g8306 [Verticillium dahliae]PNH63753.1 hypothetical protein VD0001_g9060 [Verticillium dahliae]RBQ69162.1 hypothetical protein VDGD_21564 [Verticillium dahliae]